MSDYNGSNGDGAGEETPSVVDRAIHAVRSQPLNEDSLEQTLSRLRSQSPAPRRMPSRFRFPIGRRWLLASGAAAALLVAATVWLGRPSASWAQVAEALRGKPWIHGVGKLPGGEASEFWFSSERDVYADRRGDWAMFDDARLQVRYEYDPKEKQIVRATMPDKEAGRSAAELFSGITRGRVRAGLTFSGREVVGQEERRVVDKGREWLEYDLTLRITYDLASNNRHRMRFRVDPESHLPHSMSVSDMDPAEQANRGPETMEFVFDYPDEGPRDIYDLGVPRTAKLIDRVPTADFSRVLAAVDSARNRFDSYFAIAVRQVKDQPWYTGAPDIVWRKGDRWRAEIGGLTQMPPKPAADVDRVEWWKEQLPSCIFSPIEVCDGETVYRVKFDQPDAQGKQTHTWEAVRKIEPRKALERAGQAAHSMPEMFGYPIGLQDPAHVFTVDVIPDPGEGPAESLLVKYLTAGAAKNDRSFRDCRYWVDPAKGYVTRRYALADAHNPDGSTTTDTYTMEELERSPRGLWYPTLVRRKVAQDPPPAAPNYVDETVTRFFVDFDAELPDDLFRPVDRETDKR